MRLVIQRVKKASVTIDNNIVGKINQGFMVLVGLGEGDTEGFVNMPLSIADVRMSILAKEDTDRVRISIRSKRGTSANMCARLFFNGGGHENAAGGRLQIPAEVKAIESVADYIERTTHLFLKDE